VTTKVLLCSDLDRTILPNGPQPESPQARELLAGVAARTEVTLVYVTGRHEALIREAIREFLIPEPDYAIGDVGTTIYEIHNGKWVRGEVWEREIAADWRGKERQALAECLAGLPGLDLQEPQRQNRHKLSYYTLEKPDLERLLGSIRERLDCHGIRASLVWSVDEAKHVGLLDVLPERATKLHAIQFLMRQNGFFKDETIFAGDSGNDLPVLTSGLQAVLVRNAPDEVRRAALQEVQSKGLSGSLYLAQGGFLGMNGNYAAGVLEGLAHFVPATQEWMVRG
jgi:sucrose-6F-phosphate phosphohydrolase